MALLLPSQLIDGHWIRVLTALLVRIAMHAARSMLSASTRGCKSSTLAPCVAARCILANATHLSQPTPADGN